MGGGEDLFKKKKKQQQQQQLAAGQGTGSMKASYVQMVMQDRIGSYGRSMWLTLNMSNYIDTWITPVIYDEVHCLSIEIYRTYLPFFLSL